MTFINSIPNISICIPAYKRIDSLKILLESICAQDYLNFEVIITDDSPDDSVKQLFESYYEKIPLRYYKNSPALGTPENWNEGIRKATGQWIKIMHDDDWFLHKDSLSKFAATLDAKGKLVFSGFKNIKENENENDGEEVRLSSIRKYLLKQNPVSILSKNCIGPPSVTLFERLPLVEFDKNLKWLVDMEFYIRQLKEKSIFYINEPLIGIGLSNSQVTASSSLNPNVEIPEHLYLLEKLGIKALNNVPFYDAYWRLFRNLCIYDISTIKVMLQVYHCKA
ncbi:MAG: glycosyltransferase family 2 protein [Chitinophagaceae bacterium]|nr:glycosyltransferase family 2 protein [Chitinophagaceae bacterium]